MDSRWLKRYRWPVALMLVFACLAIVAGAEGLRRWPAISAPSKAYYTVFTTAGVGLLLCAVAALVRRRLSRVAAWGGLAAALSLGVCQAAGLKFNAILCFTPG